MQLLDGKALAKDIEERLKQRVLELSPKPKLLIIQVGEREESNRYIKFKKSFGERIGVGVEHVGLPESASEADVLSRIEEANTDTSVTGIIIQLPLPAHMQSGRILASIDPKKDVDGLAPGSTYTPATPKGIMTLLAAYGIETEGKHAVVIGRSKLVGRPIAELLLQKDATVTICHSHTRNLPSITREADIIVTAVGKPNLITKDHVRAGQTIIDVGRDVDFEPVKEIVFAITPPIGGVGPMTVASLFENIVS